jgi:hypothetical protein
MLRIPKVHLTDGKCFNTCIRLAPLKFSGIYRYYTLKNSLTVILHTVYLWVKCDPKKNNDDFFKQY